VSTSDHSEVANVLALNLMFSAARLRGFEEDLGLVGNQFATVLGIINVGYIFTQVPSYVSPLPSTANLY